jgi:hypothetical protein
MEFVPNQLLPQGFFNSQLDRSLPVRKAAEELVEANFVRL